MSRPTSINWDRVKVLVSQGLSTSEIALRLQVGADRLRGQASKHGITLNQQRARRNAPRDVRGRIIPHGLEHVTDLSKPLPDIEAKPELPPPSKAMVRLAEFCPTTRKALRRRLRQPSPIEILDDPHFDS